mgnify:CR=1 FL=1
MDEEPNEDWLTTRVLVCGDRNWTDQRVIGTVLNGLLEEAMLNFGWLVVIDGCARGADSFACHFFDGNDPDHPCVTERGGVHAGHTHVKHEHYPADWDQYGRSAGPIRNQHMLEQGKPDLVIAFPGGRGTSDMMTRARSAGIPVMQVTP